MRQFLKFIFEKKTLHVSNSSSLHRQEFFTVHTAMVRVIKFCCVYCCVYSEKLLMMDRGTVRNRQSFIPKKNLEISAYSWFYYKKLSRVAFTWMSKYWSEFDILNAILQNESQVSDANCYSCDSVPSL